jgi:hypothetical protein
MENRSQVLFKLTRASMGLLKEPPVAGMELY